MSRNTNTNTNTNPNISRNNKNDKKSYQKNENYVKYHFSDKKELLNKYYDINISSDKIAYVYKELRKLYGETDIIKDYSLYKHNNLELTVFPDGSSFCRRVRETKVKDEKFPEIFVSFLEKFKLSNDYFPCQYNYNSTQDVIDIIFSVNSNIDIILSTKYENNNLNEKIKEINEISRPIKLKTTNKTWCELYLLVKCSANIDNIHKTINILEELVV